MKVFGTGRMDGKSSDHRPEHNDLTGSDLPNTCDHAHMTYDELRPFKAI